MRFIPASDSSLLVSFGDGQSSGSHEEVVKLLAALQRTEDPRIRNLHPAYASLLVDYDPLRLDFRELEEIVQRAARAESATSAESRTIDIPVCYGGEGGPDLEFVAQHCAITIDEVIRLHSSAQYQVAFLGFSPGFAYLTGLPPGLVTPRRPTPRKLVPAGSVAIAGTQAGVYPLDSPGGWQILGTTPLTIFDSRREQPSLLQTGDIVRFVPMATHDCQQQMVTREPRA